MTGEDAYSIISWLNYYYNLTTTAFLFCTPTSHPPPPPPQEHAKALETSDEKIGLANQTYDLVGR